MLILAGCSPAARLTARTATTTTVTIPTTTPPRPTTVRAEPPYPVTELVLPLVDPTRPTVSGGRMVSSVRKLTTLVWVPQAAGRRPLIVFAHGFDVGPAPYTALLQTWAAHGYVVAAPEFPLTDPAVAGINLDEADIVNQPADVRFVTDWLIGPLSPVANRIDPSRAAVAGHSDGAETALASAAAPAPAGEPGYRAAIVLGAQPVPSASGHNPPILVAQGDADPINPPSNGIATFQQAASPKYLLTIHGGGHLAPLEAGSAWLAGIEAVSLAFLDAYLAADAPPSGILSAGASFPDLSVTTG